jgi:molybdopterin adenylyltransferase
MQAGVLTVSDSRSSGDATDEGGARLVEFAKSLGAEVVAREVLPDEQPRIEQCLREWSDRGDLDLILTTGGTGFAPRDVTPEATRSVIEREAPGIAEAMRLASREHTEMWVASRGIAGTRGRSLIVNFPGNPPAIEQAGAAIEPALPHVLGLLRR